MIRYVAPFLALLGVGTCLAETAPAQPAPQTVTGCVARIPNVTGKYVLATGHSCMLLNGAYDPTKVADHEITATGTVAEASGMMPLTLSVQSVQSVNAACTKTCVLEPPGTRGIHGKERPGAEGGTPGLQKTPGAEPQN